MTDRALFGDTPAESPPASAVEDSLHLVVDLTDGATSQLDLPGPWLSENANLINAGATAMRIRRAVDVVASAAMLMLLSPVLVVVALLTKLTSPGPVLFKQRRVGMDGVEFDILKFRSMIEDAGEQRSQLLDVNEASGPVFKMRNDPRITPFGHVIRRASIDELPQLWNVLRGT